MKKRCNKTSKRQRGGISLWPFSSSSSGSSSVWSFFGQRNQPAPSQTTDGQPVSAQTAAPPLTGGKRRKRKTAKKRVRRHKK